MGGRGTYASGIKAKQTYKQVAIIGGVKVLVPIDDEASLKLPEESHSSKAYILLDSNGKFKQYREYNKDHKVILDIDYHIEPKFDKRKKILHVHEYPEPGIENRKFSKSRLLTNEELKWFRRFFKGGYNER